MNFPDSFGKARVLLLSPSGLRYRVRQRVGRWASGHTDSRTDSRTIPDTGRGTAAIGCAGESTTDQDWRCNSTPSPRLVVRLYLKTRGRVRNPTDPSLAAALEYLRDGVIMIWKLDLDGMETRSSGRLCQFSAHHGDFLAPPTTASGRFAPTGNACSPAHLRHSRPRFATVALRQLLPAGMRRAPVD